MDDLDGFVAPDPAAALGRVVTVLRETASTNDDARRAAAEGAPHGAVFVADAQTAGRGRLGRAWHSPPGDNLYASILLRPNALARDLALLPLAAGLAIAEAVDEVADVGATIKWPNDVLVGGRKLAGVLVEGALRGDRFQHVVVGVGVNVRGARPPDEVADLATTLRAASGRAPSRREVLARLLARFEARLDALERGRGDEVIAAVHARCVTLGRRVRVGLDEGVATAVEADGGLRVRFDDGSTRSVHGSDGLSLVEAIPRAPLAQLDA